MSDENSIVTVEVVKPVLLPNGTWLRVGPSVGQKNKDGSDVEIKFLFALKRDKNGDFVILTKDGLPYLDSACCSCH